MVTGLRREHLLHGVEQLPIDDRRMGAGVARIAVRDLANVGSVLQQMKELAAIED